MESTLELGFYCPANQVVKGRGRGDDQHTCSHSAQHLSYNEQLLLLVIMRGEHQVQQCCLLHGLPNTRINQRVDSPHVPLQCPCELHAKGGEQQVSKSCVPRGRRFPQGFFALLSLIAVCARGSYWTPRTLQLSDEMC